MTALMRWQIPPQSDLTWWHRDSQTIVYHAQSADTHLLDLVASTGFACFESGPLDLAGLHDSMAQRLEIAADDQLMQYARALITRLERLGLLEAIDG